MIVVCPSRTLAEVCRHSAPSDVATFVSPGRPAPAVGADARHLALAFNDIIVPGPGLIAPRRSAIEALLAFAGEWDGARPMVVSCELGISRSPAAAFAIACARDPARAEREIALDLRRASPCATPNPLIVALADHILGRDGRMIAAIESLGRGADYEPYAFFELPDLGPRPAIR